MADTDFFENIIDESNVTFRVATVEDAAAMAEIEKRCFSHPWSQADLENDISTNELAFYIVAEKNEIISKKNRPLIGYAGVWTIVGEGHITNVAVDIEYRRQGFAKEVLRRMMYEATERGITRFTLEVRRSNKAAIGLYEKLGFKIVGYRKGYYSDNDEDAAIMWKIS